MLTDTFRPPDFDITKAKTWDTYGIMWVECRPETWREEGDVIRQVWKDGRILTLNTPANCVWGDCHGTNEGFLSRRNEGQTPIIKRRVRWTREERDKPSVAVKEQNGSGEATEAEMIGDMKEWIMTESHCQEFGMEKLHKYKYLSARNREIVGHKEGDKIKVEIMLPLEHGMKTSRSATIGAGDLEDRLRQEDRLGWYEKRNQLPSSGEEKIGGAHGEEEIMSIEEIQELNLTIKGSGENKIEMSREMLAQMSEASGNQIQWYGSYESEEEQEETEEIDRDGAEEDINSATERVETGENENENEMERGQGVTDTIAANERTTASRLQEEDPVKLERYLEREAWETDPVLDQFLADREGFKVKAKQNCWRYAKKNPDALADEERMHEANRLYREAKKAEKSKGKADRKAVAPLQLSRLIIMEVLRSIVRRNTTAEVLEYLEKARAAALAVTEEFLREQWQQAAPVFTHMQEWIREREKLGQLTVDDQIIRQSARMLFIWRHGVCRFRHADDGSGWGLEALDVDAIREIK